MKIHTIRTNDVHNVSASTASRSPPFLPLTATAFLVSSQLQHTIELCQSTIFTSWRGGLLVELAVCLHFFFLCWPKADIVTLALIVPAWHPVHPTSSPLASMCNPLLRLSSPTARTATLSVLNVSGALSVSFLLLCVCTFPAPATSASTTGALFAFAVPQGRHQRFRFCLPPLSGSGAATLSARVLCVVRRRREWFCFCFPPKFICRELCRLFVLPFLRHR